MKMKVLDCLAIEPQPLYPAEIANKTNLKRSQVLDILSRMYRHGEVAKAAARASDDCVWVAPHRVDKLPRVNAHKPLLPFRPRSERMPEELKRDPVRIDPRRIMHNRSVFDWRP
jgi:hypothetical protein